MNATLRERSWLRRVVHVQLDSRFFIIEYNGRGFGYESVHVNGRLAARDGQWLSPYLVCPRIEFVLGDVPAVIEVRVWPWLAMRSFRLLVAGQLVFEDTGQEVSAAGEEWGNTVAVGRAEVETGIRVAGQTAVKPRTPTDAEKADTQGI